MIFLRNFMCISKPLSGSSLQQIHRFLLIFAISVITWLLIASCIILHLSGSSTQELYQLLQYMCSALILQIIIII